MARPRSAIPSYRKHKSGQARVTINGRDYYLGPYGTQASKREYDRLLAEYLASGRSGSFGAAADQLTLAMLIRDYVAHAKRYYGSSKRGELRNVLLTMKPLKALYASLPVLEFGPGGGIHTAVPTAWFFDRTRFAADWLQRPASTWTAAGFDGKALARFRRIDKLRGCDSWTADENEGKGDG